MVAVVQPDGSLYRLARAPDPWAWPDWSYAGLDGAFGNRWAIPAAEAFLQGWAEKAAPLWSRERR